MRRLVLLLLASSLGCAQISTRSRVEITPREGAAPVVIGPPDGTVTARGIDASWTQDGNTLEVVLTTTRQCSVQRHLPVVRAETLDRRVEGGALFWEFGLGGAFLTVGLIALIRPELFGQRALNSEGETVRDTRAGYRLGGIFTGLAAVALAAGTYDAIRARDDVRYSDAYRVEVGEPTACAKPQRAMAERTIELVVDEWTTTAKTDADGRVRLLLPKVDELPPERPVAGGLSDTVRQSLADGSFFDVSRFDAVQAAGPTRWAAVEEEGTTRWELRARTVPGVLRLGGGQAVRVDFAAPYDHADAREHAGEIEVEPQPIRATPVTPKKSEESEKSEKSEESEKSEKSDAAPGEPEADAES